MGPTYRPNRTKAPDATADWRSYQPSSSAIRPVSTSGGLGLWSERPLILLVAPIAIVQAPNYLLAHRGIAGYRDREALRCHDLRVPLPRPGNVPIGAASVDRTSRPGLGHTLKKLNSIRSKHWFAPFVESSTRLIAPVLSVCAYQDTLIVQPAADVGDIALPNSQEAALVCTE